MGHEEIDQQALAYYRYAWAVQDIGAFAEDVFARPELSEAARAQSLRYFKSLFDSGMIVDKLKNLVCDISADIVKINIYTSRTSRFEFLFIRRFFVIYRRIEPQLFKQIFRLGRSACNADHPTPFKLGDLGYSRADSSRCP